MKKYKIKNDAEFIKEFGKNWRDNTWNPDGLMDYLFGKELTSDEIEEVKLYGRVYIDTWVITKNDIKKIETPDYSPRKLDRSI